MSNSILREEQIWNLAFRADSKTLGTSEGILTGVNYDAVSVSYPNTTTEVYQFLSGGLTGDVQATVTLVYTSASKNDLVSVERT